VLVIYRKEGESILVGRFGEIRIKVLKISFDSNGRFTVDLGFQAPKSIPVCREELFQVPLSQEVGNLTQLHSSWKGNHEKI